MAGWIKEWIDGWESEQSARITQPCQGLRFPSRTGGSPAHCWALGP